MNALFRLDSIGSSVTSLLRASRSGSPFGAIDTVSGIRSALGLEYSNNLASRLLAAKSAAAVGGRSQTDARSAAQTEYTDFASRTTEHSISIRSLASSAEARSAAFETDDVVRAGTLTLSVHGVDYNITLAGDINDVATALREAGAPIEVGTSTDGVKEFLTLSAREAGYDIGGTPDEALSLTETYTGTSGKTLGLEIVKQATNAEVVVDGRSYVRQTNEVSDVGALYGTTLRLEELAASGGAAFVSTPFKAGLAAGRPDGIQTVAIEKIARSAEGESESFDSPFSTVRGGLLQLQVASASYNIPIADGSTLGDVASRIQQSGAPVNVSIKTDGAGYKLAISSRETGFRVGGTAADALKVTEDSFGSGGQALGIAITQEATNAQLKINGKAIESATNVIRGAIPGVTFDLKNASGVAETLVGNLDQVREARGNLADASNEVYRVLQDQLLATPVATTSASATAVENPNEVKGPSSAFTAQGRTDGQGGAATGSAFNAGGPGGSISGAAGQGDSDKSVNESAAEGRGKGPFGATASNTSSPFAPVSTAKSWITANDTELRGGFSNLAVAAGEEKKSLLFGETKLSASSGVEESEKEATATPAAALAEDVREAVGPRNAFAVRAYKAYLEDLALAS
jgi:flagellar capping protein FliD